METQCSTMIPKKMSSIIHYWLEQFSNIWVYVNGGTCLEPPEPPGTPRNLPGTLKKAQMIKLKKKQITKNNTNQIKIMKMK